MYITVAENVMSDHSYNLKRLEVTHLPEFFIIK